MDKSTISRIVKLYKKGQNVRQIAHEVPYNGEWIRTNLKRANCTMRGRGAKYFKLTDLNSKELCLFAELLGYLYGDGSLHKYKTYRQGWYECTITFALNEIDLVKRVQKIVKVLYKHKPRFVTVKGRHTIILRRSIAKHIAAFGYPCGKKSVLNDGAPLDLLSTLDMRKSFLCGFLNSEASTSSTLAVQQSIRINLPKNQEEELRKLTNPKLMNNKIVYFVKWSLARKIIDQTLRQSRVLLDIRNMLKELNIGSRIYPVRIYLGETTSVHYELWVPVGFVKVIKENKLLSCKKKVKNLNYILRACRSGQS